MLRRSPHLRCVVVLAGLLLAPVLGCRAQSTGPTANPVAGEPAITNPIKELAELMARIGKKTEAGLHNPADFSEEVSEIDAFVAKYGTGKSDAAARLRLTQAMVYHRVLRDEDKAFAMLQQLRKDIPRSSSTDTVDELIAELTAYFKAVKTRTAILGGAAPALKFAWSTQPELKSLAALKGKVAVLVFWTTQSKPSIAALPALRELAARYRNAAVVLVSVTSIQGRVDELPGGGVDCAENPANEKRLLGIFARLEEMTWPVAVSNDPVFNPRFGVTDLPHLTIVAPNGVVRYNGLNPAAPLAETAAKIDPILKEFGLAVP